MDDRNDFPGETQTGTDNHTAAEQGTGTRLGLDVGTNKVLVARRKGKEVASTVELNAFLAVPSSPVAESTLRQNGVPFYRDGDELVVYGTATEKFAGMLNTPSRRPMANGILNPREPAATLVLEAILGKLVGQARAQNDLIAFSVPAPPSEGAQELTYHEQTLRRFIQAKGYRPLAVNEGLAIVLAELEANHFTGIGISCGGGMCNVALAYLSIPAVTFSVPKGGDHIDSAVAAVTNENATRVKMIKEAGLDLTQTPKDKVEKALHIYYDDLIQTLLETLRTSMVQTNKLPRSDRPLPIVLAGGTSKPTGFRDRFESALRAKPLPFEIGEVRIAQDPMTATARGALVAALAEK
jgi:actin-like ATPase involved in cell morphogenesis